MLNNRFNISTPLVVSLVTLGLGGLIVLVYFFGVVAALVGPGTGDVEPDAMLAKYVSKNEKQLEEYEQGFNGRSVFFIPKARQIIRAPIETGPISTPPPPPPPPPPAPTTYNGPTPAWAIGNEVWFREKKQGDPMLRLRVGEEADGVELVRVNLPKEIVVKQHGKEFPLPMIRSIPWVTDADQVLGSDAGKPKSADLKGMKVIGPDGKPAADEPTMSASDLELRNSGNETNNSAAMEDDEFVGPPVPEELADDVIESEPLPIPEVSVELENDPATPEAMPVDTQDAGGAVDSEAEQAAQNEAGDSSADEDEETDPQQPESDDPDNPGPPPE